jgi:hypothetical protein
MLIQTKVWDWYIPRCWFAWPGATGELKSATGYTASYLDSFNRRLSLACFWAQSPCRRCPTSVPCRVDQSAETISRYVSIWLTRIQLSILVLGPLAPLPPVQKCSFHFIIWQRPQSRRGPFKRFIVALPGLQVSCGFQCSSELSSSDFPAIRCGRPRKECDAQLERSIIFRRGQLISFGGELNYITWNEDSLFGPQESIVIDG